MKKKPRGFGVLLDKMADNDYIKLDNREFKAYTFRSKTAVFEMQKLLKIGNAPRDDLKHLTVKRTVHALNTHPRGPNFTPFRSTTNHFRDIGGVAF